MLACLLLPSSWTLRSDLWDILHIVTDMKCTYCHIIFYPSRQACMSNSTPASASYKNTSYTLMNTTQILLITLPMLYTKLIYIIIPGWCLLLLVLRIITKFPSYAMSHTKVSWGEIYSKYASVSCMTLVRTDVQFTPSMHDESCTTQERPALKSTQSVQDESSPTPMHTGPRSTARMQSKENMLALFCPIFKILAMQACFTNK